MTSLSTPRLDVRTIVPRQRHALIFQTFGALAGGQSMELVNDHDPRPLKHHFEAEMPGEFSWNYLEEGPEVWRVSITRTAAAASSPCCGACGGA